MFNGMILFGESHCSLCTTDKYLMFSDPTSYTGAYIRLEQRTFTVTEGVDETVRICAEVYNPAPDWSCCPVVFDFKINLSVDGGKLSVITFQLMIRLPITEDFPMEFRPCSHRACMPVPIEDCDQIERTTTHRYRLERTDDLDRRIIVVTTSGTLTVVDNPTDGT